MHGRAAAQFAAIAFACRLAACVREAAPQAAPASLVNPRPVRLVRPHDGPLSPPAQLGRALFFDSSLSRSGRSSCASCHVPARAYAAAPGRARPTGGRTVPSLRYVDRTPRFHIGPDVGESDAPLPPAAPAATAAGPVPRAAKHAGAAGPPAPATPRGGLFWDGRASTLQVQAMAPLFDRSEMANTSVASLAARIRRQYGTRFAQLFGAETLEPPDRLVAEATFAITRFELEDPSFHPYDSKYDAYLEGRAALSAEEARGLALFDDPAKGNCAACHLDRPGKDHLPPAFTDYEYEALGVPRNTGSGPGRAAGAFDLGLCGPVRTDLSASHEYCGMFRTPSLRNVATRDAFFHNGEARSLQEVLAFYSFRDAAPERVYPRTGSGAVARFNDLPEAYRANVDVSDPPFGRRLGDPGALTDAEMRDVIEFLRTLTDGYRGAPQKM